MRAWRRSYGAGTRNCTRGLQLDLLRKNRQPPPPNHDNRLPPPPIDWRRRILSHQCRARYQFHHAHLEATLRLERHVPFQIRAVEQWV